MNTSGKSQFLKLKPLVTPISKPDVLVFNSNFELKTKRSLKGIAVTPASLIFLAKIS